jgi:hypothetical protein
MLIRYAPERKEAAKARRDGIGMGLDILRLVMTGTGTNMVA